MKTSSPPKEPYKAVRSSLSRITDKLYLYDSNSKRKSKTFISKFVIFNRT